MKTIYDLMLLLFLLIPVQAQITEIREQGIPQSLSSQKKSTVGYEQFNSDSDKLFDHIVNWTGHGSNRAALIIKWNDGKNPDAMVWGYRWDGDKVNVIDMIKAIAKAEHNLFFLLKNVTTSDFGVIIGGIGYNINQENQFKLTLYSDDQIPTNGIFPYVFFPLVSNSSMFHFPTFIDWICNNPYDHWVTESPDNNSRWNYYYRNINDKNYFFDNGFLDQILLTNNSLNVLWYGDKSVENFITDKFTVSPKYDYSKDVYFLNENCVGQDNGTLNYLDRFREFTYDIYRKKNDEGSTFGIKSTFGTVYDGKLFVISKEKRRVVVANALTLEAIKTIDTIKSPSNRVADGRAFVGITPELGYISTSTGICTFNLKNYRIGQFIPGTDGETGNMILAANHVFAVQRNRVLILKNDVVTATISGCNYSSVCKSKDGMVWIAAGYLLIKVDPVTLEQEKYMLPSRAKIGNSWIDWNAGSFCASTYKNALYWTNSDLANSGKDVYCYEIGDGLSLMNPIYTLPKDQVFYGAGIRVHPATNLLYITSTRNLFYNFNKNWVHVVDSSTGQIIKVHEINSYNWFPSMIFFPEVQLPSKAESAQLVLNKNRLLADRSEVKQKRAYRSGDRLFNLHTGALVEAYRSGVFCFKMKADHSELKIPQKGIFVFKVISDDGIQVIK